MGQFNKCPANWENVLEGIRKISYSDHDTTRDWEDDDDDILSPKDRRFAVLASSLLSSQTKEHVTRGKHIYLLIFMLLETFFLVGFYIRKASVGPKIAHLVMIIAWNNVQGPDMCRYSCPPHLQSSWMGFEIRHKTENFNTRRNKKGAGTMVASEGRMGSNKSSFVNDISCSGATNRRSLTSKLSQSVSSLTLAATKPRHKSPQPQPRTDL
ncbi:alpha,alpha-trehalase nth1, variant 2 [Trifolium repens]|nr:alpha,alpha-trehalase nth1, variant 2 [Trifolium repens]